MSDFFITCFENNLTVTYSNEKIDMSNYDVCHFMKGVQNVYIRTNEYNIL